MDILYLYDFVNIDILEIEKEKQIKANININEKDNELIFSNPLKLDLTINRKGFKFHFNGNIETDLILQCDRCLDKFFYTICADFNFLFIYNEDKLEYINGSNLILKNLIFGEIYLNIPYKKLCKLECKGLCPICGENLNKIKCNCKTDDKINPFYKLKALYN